MWLFLSYCCFTCFVPLLAPGIDALPRVAPVVLSETVLYSVLTPFIVFSILIFEISLMPKQFVSRDYLKRVISKKLYLESWFPGWLVPRMNGFQVGKDISCSQHNWLNTALYQETSMKPSIVNYICLPLPSPPGPPEVIKKMFHHCS
jgi:hypothetical protein